ncbi:glycosyltransferase family 9 protein [Actinomadura sp. CNU-125]|uniref:glycosyltransferase family 9 protein n=1 Tax=Actinomadura sp. CNU-125 TaxID=1904961 RepID=UPI0021CC71DF|nr:glycosyltransferase family 9 protein [Actinomadura sp. CNU-125]
MAVTAGSGAVRRMLVLRALGLGDLLTAVPALRALRRGALDARITLAAPDALAPLARATGAVDAVLDASGLDVPLPPDGRVDEAVNLHGRGPRSHRLLAATGPGRLLAFAHPGFPEAGGPEWDAREHEAARWCRLVAAYGFDADPADLALPRPEAASPAPGAVVVHPGAAYRPAAGPRTFAAVAAALRDAGERVVVTGGPAETAAAGRVVAAAGLGAAADLSGRTGLPELAALVAGARLVVCGDTGVAHLATAYRTPSVVLFGPTPPDRWGPPPDRPEHTVLWAGRHGDRTRGAGPGPAGDHRRRGGPGRGPGPGPAAPPRPSTLLRGT